MVELRKITNDNKSADLMYGQGDYGNISVGNSFMAVTNSDMNIYSDASEAIGKSSSSTDSKAMYTVKAGTAIRITGRANSGTNVVLQVKCGSKTGYIFAGTVSERSSGSSGVTRSWKWNSKFLNFYIYNTATLETLKLSSSDVSSTKSTYTSCLNNGDEINEKVLVAKGGDETAEDNSDSTTSAAVAATNANAENSNSGEINVTYEHSITLGPQTPWNIADHYGGTEYFNESNTEMVTESKKGFNYTKLRNIFGIPYQFLPTTDCRVGAEYSSELEKAGYEFSEKIIARLPLLYITPGNSSFMGGTTEEARTALLGSLGSNHKNENDSELFESSLETMLGEYNGKLYTIMPAYTEYFSYVNPLCRAGAIFLDIGGTSFNSTSISGNSGLETDSASFANMNWGVNEGLAYEIWKEQETAEEESVEDSEEVPDANANTTETDQEAEKPERQKFDKDYSDFFVQYEEETSTLNKFEKNLYYGNSIAFYINSEVSFQDSFTNETTESTLSSTINALSDKAREIQFLLGTAKSAVGEAFDKVDGTLSNIKEQINNIVKNVAGGNSIFTTIANSVKTIVSGGRMLFPQIWGNSTFSKSYNISIKLTTPNTDRVSWFLNIYVPLCHLMALVLPRSEYVNSYTTPFIIKAFYKGMFNIDMGIITEMTFNRGKEGSWTKDALPTVVDVSFTIQDLYSAMGMTSTESMFKGTTLQNVAEMDYIANLCGININEPDTFRMVNLWCAFNMTNKVYDFIPNLSMGIEQYISTGIVNAYNNFWMN